MSSPEGLGAPSPAASWRLGLAVRAVRVINRGVRLLRLGSGTVAGGRVGLAIAPGLLRSLLAGRTTALVSGTNGKTTTTRLLAVALGAGSGAGSTEVAGPGATAVVTNATGSNMPAGHVAALADAAPGAMAVLEVDEGYLPELVATARPAVVVLLNLSRDQLDRTNEVRMTANRWRAALAGSPATVVANADDPLVVWAAGGAQRCVWVAAGLRWRFDAVGCPACEGRIRFCDGWGCDCGYRRPEPAVAVEDSGGGVVAAFADGRRLPVELRIPGRFNQANAVLAAVAAEALGVRAAVGLRAMQSVDAIAGRFAVHSIAGAQARLLLAKNPAGWAELLDIVGPSRQPVVVGINARVADGRDPSWLWDVPFEALRGRRVVATGERCLDLSVRLRYAEVDHDIVRDPRHAIARAAGFTGVADPSVALNRGADGATDVGAVEVNAKVEFIGNYTAFHDLLGR